MSDDESMAARLTAYVLGQLPDAERPLVESLLRESEDARRVEAEIRRLADVLRTAEHNPVPPPLVKLRSAVLERLDGQGSEKPMATPVSGVTWRKRTAWRKLAIAVAACLLIALVPLTLWDRPRQNTSSSQRVASNDTTRRAVGESASPPSVGTAPVPADGTVSAVDSVEFGGPRDTQLLDALKQMTSSVRAENERAGSASAGAKTVSAPSGSSAGEAELLRQLEGGAAGNPAGSHGKDASAAGGIPSPGGIIGTGGGASGPGRMGGGGAGMMPGGGGGMISGRGGMGGGGGAGGGMMSGPGGMGFGVGAGGEMVSGRGGMGGMGGAGGGMMSGPGGMGVRGYGPRGGAGGGMGGMGVDDLMPGFDGGTIARGGAPGSEQYDAIVENAFQSPAEPAHALSTFAIDVDTAAYANVRRFLNSHQLPPADAVRIEELVNYFSYDYPAPDADGPFSVNMEVAQCPWQQGHLLLRIGLQGKEIAAEKRPPCNLVFLVDVSGSMADANKLPLLRQSLQLLTSQLTESDRVTIVTYAGEAGLRLDTTTGDRHAEIGAAIDTLHPGGSTHGSAGIQLAYDKAVASFLPEATNRVILATDGDLNVGITNDKDLVNLIEQRAKSGVFLTVLGFGTGNLKDAKLEKLADHGNGFYAYVDSFREARRVLVERLSGSLVTIAKDVKVQVEFNPAEIRQYRLIGYENRRLAAADFRNDAKDGGEIGAGHRVTVLYELVPHRAPLAQADVPGDRPLKYQQAGQRAATATSHPGTAVPPTDNAAASTELLTLYLRYKQPDGATSQEREFPLLNDTQPFGKASADFRFAASVASFGMILRQSTHRGETSLAGVAEIAAASIGDDPHGYRAEFVNLVQQAAEIRRLP